MALLSLWNASNLQCCRRIWHVRPARRSIVTVHPTLRMRQRHKMRVPQRRQSVFATQIRQEMLRPQSVHHLVHARFYSLPGEGRGPEEEYEEDDEEDELESKKQEEPLPEDEETEMFDWANFDEETAQDLPDLPSDEVLAKEDKWWESLNAPGYQVDANMLALPHDQLPHVQLENSPLGVPTEDNKEKFESMSPVQKRLLVEKYNAEIKILLSAYKIELAWDTFLEMRDLGLIPNAETYEVTIGTLVAWNAHEAMDMLIKEMDSLGYKKGEFTHNALITRALVMQVPEEIERTWQDALDAKLDINAHMYGLRLFYLCRYTNDLDAIVNFFKLMKANGKVTSSDLGPYNVLLDMFVSNNLFEMADELFAGMEKSGVLNVDPEKDSVTIKYAQDADKLVPKYTAAEVTYLLMVELNAARDNKVGVDEFMKRAEKSHYDFYNYKQRKFIPPRRTFDKLIHMHIRMGNATEAIRVTRHMSDLKLVPTRESWLGILTAIAKMDPPRNRDFLDFWNDFDMWGFEPDSEATGAIVNMWYRAKDYRRAKNAYDAAILAGVNLDADARTAMMEVYAVAGQPDDIQKFYENQLRADRKPTRRMHELMINDFVGRGFPGSARQILVRMRNDGCPAGQDIVEKIALAYGELGGGSQVQALIKEEISLPGSGYSVTATVVAALIQGFSKKVSDLEKARNTWDKMCKSVQLDFAAGYRIIAAFAQLQDGQYAVDVYNKLKNDWKFLPNDGPFLFEKLLSAPPASSNIEGSLDIVSDMRSFGIPPTRRVYNSILAQAISLRDLRAAIRVLKEYVKEFRGTIELGTCAMFFSAMVRLDFGRYRREAQAWIRRLVPNTNEDVLKPRPPLEEFEKGFLTSLQSYEVARYLERIDDAQLLVAEPQPSNTELYEGGEAEIEDILIHQYGFDPDHVYQAMGTDPDFLKVKAVSEKIQAAQKKQETTHTEN